MLLERISELEEQNANLRRLEGTIERNAKMFEALLGASQDGIALTRTDGSIIRVIRGILYSPSEVSGMQMADLLHREDRETLHEAYRELVIERKQRIQCEVRVKKPAGGYLWIEIRLTDLLDDPAVMAIVINFRDISLRKRRQLNEAEMAALCDSASAAVFSVDQTGSILSWYPACEKLLAYSAVEMEGAHVHTLIPTDFEGRDRVSRSEVIETGYASGPLPAKLLTGNGRSIPVALMLYPLIQDNALQGVTYIVRPDIIRPDPPAMFGAK